MLDVGWLRLDVRQALRQLAAWPAFTFATLIILSVGIGTNTATFSLVHGLLLRPLPYPDSERIVRLGQVSAGRQRVPQIPVVLDGADGPANLPAAAVSPSLALPACCAQHRNSAGSSRTPMPSTARTGSCC